MILLLLFGELAAVCFGVWLTLKTRRRHVLVITSLGACILVIQAIILIIRPDCWFMGSQSMPACMVHLIGLCYLVATAVVLLHRYMQWNNEQVQLVLALKRLHLIMDTMPQYLVVVDSLGQVSYLNQSAREWLKAECSEPGHCSLKNILPEAIYDAIDAQVKQALTGERASYSDVPVSQDDEVMHFRIDYLPILDGDGKVDSLQIIFDDVSEQYTARQKLHEAELGMAEAMTMRHTTATYAHEINSPLMGIILNAEMLGDTELPADARLEIADEVLAAARRIQQVTDELARLEKPTYKDYAIGKSKIIDIGKNGDG